jgi:hypothetical protein
MKNHGTSMEGTKEAIAEAQRNAERLKNFINDGRQTEGDDGATPAARTTTSASMAPATTTRPTSRPPV